MQASVAQQRLVIGRTGYPNVGNPPPSMRYSAPRRPLSLPHPARPSTSRWLPAPRRQPALEYMSLQTLIISDELVLCDCPGLVLPKYAHSKAEMVVAGAATGLLCHRLLSSCRACPPLRAWSGHLRLDRGFDWLGRHDVATPELAFPVASYLLACGDGGCRLCPKAWTSAQCSISLPASALAATLPGCTAGVIPIDRLTDVGAPIDVVLHQAGIRQVLCDELLLYRVFTHASRTQPT